MGEALFLANFVFLVWRLLNRMVFTGMIYSTGHELIVARRLIVGNFVNFFATWRAIDGALTGNIPQHRRWVVGMFVGAILINGVNNVFFLPGITHDVFFGR